MKEQRIRFMLLGAGFTGTVVLFTLSQSPRDIAHDPPLASIQTFYFSQHSPIVLIGNSLLDEAVDSTLLSSQVGTRISKLWRGGMDSAGWYLILKNVVLASPYKPRVVFIFFRDYDLTWATQRVSGRYGMSLAALATPNEPLFEKLAYPRFSDHFDFFLKRHWPGYEGTIFYQEDINGALKSGLAKFLRIDPAQPNRAIAQVFDNSQMDSALLTDRQIRAASPEDDITHTPFDQQLNKSFLPAMIALTKAHRTQLVFVRMKTRNESLDSTQPAELNAYIKSLRYYLAREQCALIDFAEDPAIKIGFFGIGDHLNRSIGRPYFTMAFADTVRKVMSNPSWDRWIMAN